eukprot:139506_1
MHRINNILLLFIYIFIVNLNVNGRFISKGRASERLQAEHTVGKVIRDDSRRNKRARGGSVNNQFRKQNDEKKRVMKDGTVKYKAKQFFKGIQIFGATVVVEEDDNGDITPVSGVYYPLNDIAKHIKSINPSISQNKAIELAVESYELSLNIVDYKFNGHNNTKLYIYYFENIPRLAWFVEISHKLIILDANTGKVLKTIELLSDVNEIMGCGIGGNPRIGANAYCDKIDSAPDLENSQVVIMDNKYKPDDDQSIATPIQCISKNNNKCEINDPPTNDASCIACDAYHWANIVFDLYDDWLDIIPIKDQFMPLSIYIHVEDASVAHYSPLSGSLYFGDNQVLDGTYPYVTVDILGHEIAHGFTHKAGGLIGTETEAGAMDEAYSDLVGIVTYYYVHNSTQNWSLGCGAYVNDECLRYMYNQSKDGDSITHYKDFPSRGINNHDSSGILNKVWYLLNTKYGWTMRQLFEVVSLANDFYWTEESKLDEGACGLYDALYDVYGNNSNTDMMADNLYDAMYDVGVYCVIFPNEDDIPNNEVMKIKPDQVISVNGTEKEWKIFQIETDESFQMTGIIQTFAGFGDIDLYVSVNEIIPSSEFECISRSFTDELCVVSTLGDDQLEQIVYILVYGVTDFNVELAVNVSLHTAPVKIELNKEYMISGEPGIKQYYYFDFESDIPALSELNVKIFDGINAVDFRRNLYMFVKYGEFYKKHYYDCFTYLKLAATGSTPSRDPCALEFVQFGRYYITLEPPDNLYFQNVTLLITVDTIPATEIKLNQNYTTVINDTSYFYLKHEKQPLSVDTIMSKILFGITGDVESYVSFNQLPTYRVYDFSISNGIEAIGEPTAESGVYYILIVPVSSTVNGNEIQIITKIASPANFIPVTLGKVRKMFFSSVIGGYYFMLDSSQLTLTSNINVTLYDIQDVPAGLMAMTLEDYQELISGNIETFESRLLNGQLCVSQINGKSGSCIIENVKPTTYIIYPEVSNKSNASYALIARLYSTATQITNSPTTDIPTKNPTNNPIRNDISLICSTKENTNVQFIIDPKYREFIDFVIEIVENNINYNILRSRVSVVANPNNNNLIFPFTENPQDRNDIIYSLNSIKFENDGKQANIFKTLRDGLKLFISDANVLTYQNNMVFLITDGQHCGKRICVGKNKDYLMNIIKEYNIEIYIIAVTTNFDASKLLCLIDNEENVFTIKYLHTVKSKVQEIICPQIDTDDAQMDYVHNNEMNEYMETSQNSNDIFRVVLLNCIVTVSVTMLVMCLCYMFYKCTQWNRLARYSFVPNKENEDYVV